LNKSKNNKKGIAQKISKILLHIAACGTGNGNIWFGTAAAVDNCH